eukprot:9171695-Karenia_brevis.AAC.1
MKDNLLKPLLNTAWTGCDQLRIPISLIFRRNTDPQSYHHAAHSSCMHAVAQPGIHASVDGGELSQYLKRADDVGVANHIKAAAGISTNCPLDYNFWPRC